MAAASGAAISLSRNGRSEKRWASSDRIWRCSSVACSGTSRINSRLTGRPSGESKGTGVARRRNAPAACLRPLILPCGMAIPWPRPVEPSFSRANRLSKHDGAGQPEMAFEEHAGLLEDPLLAAGVEVEKHLRCRQEIGQRIHGKHKTKAAAGSPQPFSDQPATWWAGLSPRWWSWTFCLYFWTWRSSLSNIASMAA